LPDWVSWAQAGLTALLAVLFLVMLAKARSQAGRLEELQQRVQGLENSRALERTTGLEQQLRTTVERLQALERSNARLDVLSADNAALRSEVQQLRRSRADNGAAGTRSLPGSPNQPARGKDNAPAPPLSPVSPPTLPPSPGPLQPPGGAGGGPTP
jgi:TolA-binding protein